MLIQKTLIHIFNVFDLESLLKSMFITSNTLQILLEYVTFLLWPWAYSFINAQDKGFLFICLIIYLQFFVSENLKIFCSSSNNEKFEKSPVKRYFCSPLKLYSLLYE